MTPLSEKEISWAYTFWIRDYIFSLDDKSVVPFLKLEAESGWLQRSRRALFLSEKTVAKRMKIARSSYANLEKSEKAGAITLQRLMTAAEAMDCELIYAVRPKKRVNYSQLIWEKLVPEALQHPWLSKCDQTRRHQGLAAIAKWQMENPAVRRRHEWSEKRPSPG